MGIGPSRTSSTLGVVRPETGHQAQTQQTQVGHQVKGAYGAGRVIGEEE